MEAKPFTFACRPLIAAVLAVTALEAACAFILPGPWLLRTGAVRVLEAIVIIAVARIFYPDARLPGILPMEAAAGIKKGLIWSAGFGALAGISAAALYLAGYDPVRITGISLPKEPGQIIMLFFVGGVIGPVAEELFFRGVIFAALRRWGAAAAILGSSLVFVMAHFSNGGIAVTQAVGGLVFAFAYEIEKNLLVPITIHVLGNLALFAAGLLAVFV